MELRDGRVVSYADCAVIPDPRSEELADIAIRSAASYLCLTKEQPKVAMLTFSTKGSANHPRVDKVIDALALAKQRAPDLDIDGDMQFDAAFVPAIGKRKAPDSTVSGQTNIFVFPSLEAGNIAYKITERIGGAKAIGPQLQPQGIK
jgi:phosphotransacetylase